MSTSFHAKANVAASTVAVARSAGAGTLTMADAAAFPASYPFRLTIARQSSTTTTVDGQTYTVLAPARLCILEITGKTGNVLAVSGAIEGTADANMVVGDLAELRATAGDFQDLEGAVNGLESIVSDYGTVVTHNADEFATPGQIVTDHGVLDGLADDDHTQYHTDARAASWLAGLATITLAGSRAIAFESTITADIFFSADDTARLRMALANGTDAFFQGWPANSGGRFIFEAWAAASLDLGTGNTAPVRIAPNRVVTAEFLAGGGVKFYDPLGSTILEIRPDGSLKPAHLADSDAANDSVYYSTDAGKLAYNDGSGAVNSLY